MKAANFIVTTVAGIAMAGMIGLSHAQMNRNSPENKAPVATPSDTIASSPGGANSAGGMNKNAPENKVKNKSSQAKAEAATDTSSNTPVQPGGMNRNSPQNKY